MFSFPFKLKVTKFNIFLFGIILLSFLVSIYFYPQLPDKIASHWGINGHVNGYLPKAIGVFLLPVTILIISIFFILIPKIGPLKANIGQFIKYYNNFVIILLTFLFLIQIQILFWNIGTKISPGIVIPIGVGFLFFYTGILLEHAKRNWFIGIRTPWTLSSNVVWDRTHKLGGKLFKLSGLISFLGIIFQGYVILFIVVPILLFSGYLILYSYMEYKKPK